MQIVPLHDRILVKLLKQRPDKTKGGIYLPENVRDDSPIEIGLVLDVGSGKFTDKGAFIVPSVKVGDIVIFGQFSGANIDNPIGFEDCMLVHDSDILAIVLDYEEGNISGPKNTVKTN